MYAHEGGAGKKHVKFVELLARLFENASGALSIQVLSEFYNTATKKLAMRSAEAEEAISDLGGWLIHRPGHADVLKACGFHRRYNIAWWDVMVLNSAMELGCSILWSEDLNDGQRYGKVTIRNPFR